MSFRLVSKSLNTIVCDYLSQKYLGTPYSQECWKKLIVFMMLHQKIELKSTKTNEKLHLSREIATRLRMTKEMEVQIFIMSKASQSVNSFRIMRKVLLRIFYTWKSVLTSY